MTPTAPVPAGDALLALLPPATSVALLLMLVVVVVVVVLLLLAVPLSVTFQVSPPDAGGSELRLIWAFGLVRARVPLPPGRAPGASTARADAAGSPAATGRGLRDGARRDDDPSRHAPGTRAPRRRAPRRRDPRRRAPRARPAGAGDALRALTRDTAFLRRILRFCLDVWHAVHRERLRLHLRLGLGDPADTGRLWGLLGPLSALLARCPHSHFTLEPDFVDAVLQVEGSGTLRVIPLRLVVLALLLSLSPAFWRGMARLRRVARA